MSRAGLGRAAGRQSPPRTPTLPERFVLYQNQPNPFDGTTTIRLDLPTTTSVKLEVFDLLGRRVRTLADARTEPGQHSVVWSQMSDDGRRFSPSVYVCRLTVGTLRAERELVILP